MKKLLAILLAALMLLASAATAEEIVAQAYSPDLTVDTSENLYASACYGLWTRDIDVDGVQRQIAIYTPQNYEPCCEMLLIFCPAGKTAEEFANECGWPALAEEYGFGLTFYEALDGEWDLENPQNEIDFYLAAAAIIGTREIIDSSEAALYISGYGDGAAVAQYIALNYSSMFAGGLFMGGPAIPAEYYAEVGEKLSYPFAINSDFTLQLDGSYNKDVPMPVWIVSDGEPDQAGVDYWMGVNDVTDMGMKNPYADIYEQNKLSFTESINNKALSRVWLSQIEGAAEYFDPDFQEYAWTNFFTDIRRFTSEANGAMRVGFDADDIGLVRYDIEVKGENRFWYAYAPTYYDGSEPLALVIACPGHSISAELFAQQTEWWRVAEARNFLVVFGQGGRCTNHALSGCIAWGTSGDALERELDYFDQVIAGMCENYNVDTSRIYITGHSNGGQMTGLLAQLRPGTYAAAANVGGMFGAGEELPEANDVMIPYFGIAGRYDLGNQGVYEEGQSGYNDIQMRLALNGMSDVVAEIKDTGSYLLVTYRGTDQRVPMVQFLSNHNFHHSYTPQYSWMLWDEFFSDFSRGEDGTLYYRGTPAV